MSVPLFQRRQNLGQSKSRLLARSGIWFQDWEPGLDMNEMSRHYRSSDTSTSLLWFEEDELPERDFDRFGRRVEEEGLAELTGDLPWPGKSRRR